MKTNSFFKSAMMAAFAMVMTVNAANAASNNEALSTESAETSSAWNSEMYYVDKYANERVEAYFTDTYSQRFYAGESVYIYVKRDGDTDLDLYVYDENGNLIDSDTDTGDTCLCTFTPKWTGRFTIKVKNLGGVYNRYYIRFLQ